MVKIKKLNEILELNIGIAMLELSIIYNILFEFCIIFFILSIFFTLLTPKITLYQLYCTYISISQKKLRITQLSV